MANQTENDWAKMDTPAKLRLLSDILTKTAVDRDFRYRCLASEASATAAVAEKFSITFPPDFTLTFVNEHDSREETNRILLRLPRYEGDEWEGTIPANQENVPCTYSQWRAYRGAGKSA